MIHTYVHIDALERKSFRSDKPTRSNAILSPGLNAGLVSDSDMPPAAIFHAPQARGSRKSVHVTSAN
jgi:hypothetical protein